MNKEKTKFVKILTEYLPKFDVSLIREVIYDRKTREILDENLCSCYKGKRNPQMTWDFYQLYLYSHGENPDVYYPTEEQYVNGWTIQYELKNFLSCTENPY